MIPATFVKRSDHLLTVRYWKRQFGICLIMLSFSLVVNLIVTLKLATSMSAISELEASSSELRAELTGLPKWLQENCRTR